MIKKMNKEEIIKKAKDTLDAGDNVFKNYLESFGSSVEMYYYFTMLHSHLSNNKPDVLALFYVNAGHLKRTGMTDADYGTVEGTKNVVIAHLLFIELLIENDLMKSNFITKEERENLKMVAREEAKKNKRAKEDYEKKVKNAGEKVKEMFKNIK